MKRYLIYRTRRPGSLVKVLVITGLTGARNRYRPGAYWRWAETAEEALDLVESPPPRSNLHSYDSVFRNYVYIEIEACNLRTVCHGVGTYSAGTDLATIPWVLSAMVPFGFLPVSGGTSIPTPHQIPPVLGSKTNHKIGVPKNKLP